MVVVLLAILPANQIQATLVGCAPQLRLLPAREKMREYRGEEKRWG
jgi:hypothetical protein